MGSGPDIAGARPGRYFSCEQVHKRFPHDAGGGLQRSIGPEIRGASGRGRPEYKSSVLVSVVRIRARTLAVTEAVQRLTALTTAKPRYTS